MPLPTANTPISHKLFSNPTLYPFFQNAKGAVDGSHLFVVPPEEERATYRDREGNLSQNVLAACDFDGRFVYCLAGWEGSASDSFIWNWARQNDFTVPEGCYYLGDAGFPLCDALLVPYRGVRYHLREWAAANLR